MERPRISLRRMYSWELVGRVSSYGNCGGIGGGRGFTCLTSEQILPTSVRNLNPVIHSSVLRRVSLAKS